MFLKVHLLDSHFDFFPGNLRALSDEPKQWFHQDISTMEKWYQGKWSPSKLADYWWILRIDVPQTKYSSVIHGYFLGYVYTLCNTM
jgi:hypothetical protein